MCFDVRGDALALAAMTDIPIKDAATVILTRQSAGGLQVLMGQRGQGAAFMPNKFVFPGGAVDPEDYGLFDAKELEPTAARRLCHDAAKGAETACAAAAVRELWEETGLALAKGGTASPPPNMPPPSRRRGGRADSMRDSFGPMHGVLRGMRQIFPVQAASCRICNGSGLARRGPWRCRLSPKLCSPRLPFFDNRAARGSFVSIP